MSNSTPRRLNSLFAAGGRKQRRPAGLSRRRKKQLGFETLEDRRVMTADSPFETLGGGVGVDLGAGTQSVSSTTLEGQLEVLMREMYWQSLIANATGAETTAATPLAFSPPNDPMFGFQWHLLNSGQQVGNPDFQSIFGTRGEDINVMAAWELLNANGEALTGAGVTVAIIDSGTQLDHPDLAGNINLVLAYDTLDPNGDGSPRFIPPVFDPVTGQPTLDPVPNYHGTAVAALVGAIANNGVGGVGVAPGVTIVPIRSIDPASPGAAGSDRIVEAFRRAIQEIDITNNSWGRTPTGGRTLAGLTPEEFLAIRDSVIFGRGGLGVIHVFASGNNAGSRFNDGFNDVGNYDTTAYGVSNNRYVITVGGVDHDGSYNNVDGSVTSYMEAGANLLVVAPTGSNGAISIVDDTGVGSGIWTADLTGQYGRNILPSASTGQEFDRDFLDSGDMPNATDYTSRFNGTSAAAPLVSGVIALMLEANPNLSWRDVQEILVRSARQNAQFEIPQNGAGLATQNTWIVNQTPVFHDPDRYFAFLPNLPSDMTLRPLLDPNAARVLNTDFFTNGTIFSSDHNVAAPQLLTNGAGYTVSQGYGAYGEDIGYGHGVVDAEMAVKLAQQWHEKGQNLPSELTWTTFVNHPGPAGYNLPHAERSSDASGNQIVPGGIGGSGGFIDRWTQYFEPVPNFANIPSRGDQFIEFKVPDSQSMSIESVDVKVSISGSAGQALEHLRIMLVSPEGTQSELTSFRIDSYANPRTVQVVHPFNYVGDYGSQAPASGQFIWSFNTNRSWGERSDNSLLFDPVTGEPVVDELDLGQLSGTGSTLGEAMERGWRLVIENWDNNDDFALMGAELAFHGSPIVANSQRVQGFVGLDDNRDDLFNFSRVITTLGDNDNDPTTIRLGDVQNEIDLTQESFAANVTVNVRRASDNALVDQFVTGHDGNFYFDLVPDEYIISIEDPEGRLAQNDSITPNALLDKYRSEWRITPEHFKVWSKVDTNSDGLADATPVDPITGLPLAWTDGNGDEQVHGMKGINFLLDPGDAPLQQVEFTGVVFADTNGDGAFTTTNNSTDIHMPGITVFGDVNRNGARDAGEVAVQTDANGAYTLVVPVTSAAVMNVGVIRPTQWTSTNDGPGISDLATDGLEPLLVQPGAEIGNVNFAIKPGASGAGGGGVNQPGIILGTVFEDANGNGVRDISDQGAPQFTVYIDANNNGALDNVGIPGGDISTQTNANGAYVFTNVAPGTRIVRMIATAPNVQTSPSNNGARTIQLAGSSTVHVGTAFGVRNTATYDYGDLPDSYGITTGPNAARHFKGTYFLGQRVDGDGDATTGGNPSVDAMGDDNTSMPDEDGVDFGAGFTEGSTSQIVVNASRANGKLQLWIDWDNDGSFAQAGDRVLTNLLLLPGDNVINIDVPDGAKPQVYARFRYGNADLGLSGAASIGEVEDYRIDVAQTVVPAGNGLPSDGNQDGVVDGTDFLNWQRNVSRTSGATLAQGDANQDGRVNHLDLNEWKQDYGASVAAATGGSTAGSTASATADVQGSMLASLPEIEEEIFRYVAPATTVQLDAQVEQNAELAASASGETLATSFGLFGRGPFVDLSARTAAAGDAFAKAIDGIQDRLTRADEFIRNASDRVVERLETLDPDFLRRDRAFADLVGSRRRNGFKVDAELELPEDGDQADEAFAVFADHFEWRRG